MCPILYGIDLGALKLVVHPDLQYTVGWLVGLDDLQPCGVTSNMLLHDHCVIYTYVSYQHYLRTLDTRKGPSHRFQTRHWC